MGKLSLILLAAIGLTASYATGRALGADRRADSEMLQSADREYRARQAALSGYAEAAQRLASDPSLVGKASISPLHGRYGGSEYTVRFDVRSSVEVVVRSTAVTGSGAMEAAHVVEGLFRPRAAIGPVAASDPAAALSQVPPYMRYAIFSDKDLSLLAFPRVEANGTGFNADVHTNGKVTNLSTSMFGILPIRGFGTYSQSSLLGFTSTAAFKPPVNPDNLQTYRKIPAIDLPLFTSDGLIRDALGTAAPVTAQVPELLSVLQSTTEIVTDFRPGKVQLFGTVQLGTRQHPKLIYVDGDLVLFNATMVGYGIFVVKGSVYFDNTITGLSSLFFGKPESSVAYYTEKNVFFNGLGDVAGQIVAGGDVTFTLAPTFYGSIAARGRVNMVVAPAIRFTSPSPALTTILPGNPTTQTLQEVSAREWEV